ncbi:MAG: lipid-A-disaccharide synthase, partial [Bacteroidaceae bacterium]|nr:lipid-A-disaccharide synthase [Bacteroidaceae bacterium]
VAGQDYQLVLAGAPSISLDFYREVLARLPWRESQWPKIVRQQTYPLLHHATVALVTSGTATLETALFGVPQVVCYYTPIGKVVSFLRRHLLKVKYISLVNLVANKEVVPELVADTMTHEQIVAHLKQLMPGAEGRNVQLRGYETMKEVLGEAGAPQRAAQEMMLILKEKR